MMLKIVLKRSGGIAYLPGLNRPIEIDTQTLPHAEAAELQTLVEKAKVFSLPRQVNSAGDGSADHFRYSLTVQNGQRQHSIRFVDPIDNEPLRALVAYIQKHGAAQPNS
ncbi:MAG: protealysin inhibitor emfourin [bacterium]|nr:protealysin inhibitor emfourin [bacterium]